MPIAPKLPHTNLLDLNPPDAGPFAAWRRAMAGLFELAAQPHEIGLFEGDCSGLSTRRVALTQISASSVRLVRSAETLLRSQIDPFAVSVLVSGSLAGLAGDTEVDARAGDIFFKDLQQPLNLQTSVHGGLTREITLWIPRTRLLASVSNENALHGLVLKSTSAAAALIGSGLRTFFDKASEMTNREMDMLADGLIELIARAIVPTLEARPTADAAIPLASFVTIRRYIDRNLAAPELGVDMIARNFGLSRASLYRLFEPIGGISGYIRKQRLGRAFQEITTAKKADHRIGPIAYRLGFANINSFNRAFRDRYGVSPREARAKARQSSGGDIQTLSSETLGHGILAQWLAAMESV